MNALSLVASEDVRQKGRQDTKGDVNMRGGGRQNGVSGKGQEDSRAACVLSIIKNRTRMQHWQVHAYMQARTHRFAYCLMSKVFPLFSSLDRRSLVPVEKYRYYHCARTRTHSHTHARTHACMHACTHARMHARTHARIRMHALACTHTHGRPHTLTPHLLPDEGAQFPRFAVQNDRNELPLREILRERY